MQRRFSRRLAVIAAAGLASAPAFAADPFYLNIDVNNDGSREVQEGFSSIEDAIDGIDLANLRQRAGNYTGSEAVDVLFYLRGLNVDMGFATQGGSTLFFNVPQAGITQTFAGTGGTVAAARSDAIDQLKDYLKKNKDALKSLLSSFARFTPIDPLAGNPDSLFGQRMKNDFNFGFTHKVSQIWGCGTSAFNFTNDAPIQVASTGDTGDIFAEAQARAAELQAQNEAGIGILASSTQAQVAASGGAPGGTFSTTSITIPFSYTAKFDSDPRKKVRFDLPLTYTDTAGATSYSVGVGLAYTQPFTDDWSVTPSIGAGATGSQDLGSAGGVSTWSLTSAYTWRFSSFALSMGNSIGQYQSLGLKVGDVEAEADIKNTAYTNGFLLTGPSSLIASNLVLELSVVDTRIRGDAVYTDSSDEIGVAIGHIGMDEGVIDSYTKFGVSYLMARGVGDINSLRLTLTTRF